MMEAGLPVCEVAAKLRVHRKTVLRWWNRYLTDGTAKRKEGSGRLKLTSQQQERRLCLAVKRNRFAPVSRTYSAWATASGIRCSSRTARRIVFSAGLRSCPPLIRIPLSPTHRRLRKQWSHEHLTGQRKNGCTFYGQTKADSPSIFVMGESESDDSGENDLRHVP